MASLALAFLPLFFAMPSSADEPAEPSEPVVVVVTTPGGDDSSYQIPLTTTVTFDGVEYGSVYATTNSVITFGSPDGTYWDFPRTPSISLYSMDWVVYPDSRSDEHLTISASDGGFQVDISARPIWLQNALEPTNINIVAAINTDGTVSISYSLAGPTYEDRTRTGVRLTDGSVVTLEEYGVVRVEEPPVLAPEPVEPTPTPTPEPSPSATETVRPSEPASEPTPSPEITTQPTSEPVPTQDPTVEPTPTAEPIPRPDVPEGSTVLVEGTSIEVVAPEGQRIVSITAWYGDPGNATRGLEVSSTLTQLASGQTSVIIESSNIYGDPAGGTVKVLIFLVTYEPLPLVVIEPEIVPEVVVIPQPEPTPLLPPVQTPVIIIPEPVVTPEPVITPEPIPTEEPIVSEPELTLPPTEEPAPTPTPSEEPSAEPATEVVDQAATPEQEEASEPEPEPELPIDLAAIDPDMLSEDEIENLVIAAESILSTATQGSEEYAQALEALFIAAIADDPELPSELASIPGAEQVLETFNALGNVGADMAPKVREEAEKTVIASVIAAGAAIGAVSTTSSTGSSASAGASGSSGSTRKVK